jgi:hypothetical protein
VAQFFEVVMSELPERATFPDESEVPANPHSSLGGVIAMELAFGSALRPSHSVVTVPPSLPGPPSVLGPPSVVPPSLPGPASVPPSLPGPPSVLGPPSVVPPSLPGPASVPPEPEPPSALPFEEPPQRMVPSARQIPSAKRRVFMMGSWKKT